MILKVLSVGLLDTNCYIIECEDTKEAIIIDPGFEKAETKRVLEEIYQRDLNVKYIVNTHGHFDHISGNGIIKDATDASILIHRADTSMLVDPEINLSEKLGFKVISPPADTVLEEGDIIKIGQVRLEVIHTPGHSKGSISLFGEGVVFTGDTLFAGSIGRVDLPGASLEEIIRSIRGKLMKLSDQIIMHPGHGPPSTIGRERRNNPFLRRE